MIVSDLFNHFTLVKKNINEKDKKMTLSVLVEFTKKNMTLSNICAFIGIINIKWMILPPVLFTKEN